MRVASGLGDHYGVGTLKYNFNSEHRILVFMFGHSYKAYCIMELHTEFYIADGNRRD